MFRSVSSSLLWRGLLAIAVGVVSVALTIWVAAWALVTGISALVLAGQARRVANTAGRLTHAAA